MIVFSVLILQVRKLVCQVVTSKKQCIGDLFGCCFKYRLSNKSCDLVHRTSWRSSQLQELTQTTIHRRKYKKILYAEKAKKFESGTGGNCYSIIIHKRFKINRYKFIRKYYIRTQVPSVIHCMRISHFTENHNLDHELFK